MKYSDYAKKRLNRLGWRTLYYVSSFGLLALCFLFEDSHATRWGLLALIFILFIGKTILWLNDRKKITEENELDAVRKNAIENFYISIVNGKIGSGENWMLNRKFTSPHLINVGKENCFGYEITLHEQNDRICQKITTNVSFYSTSKNTFKIDGIDYPALLPRPDNIGLLLATVFNFISSKYRLQKNLIEKSDYTSKIIQDVREYIKGFINNILSKNYPTALNIFLSEKEFEIAGAVLEGKDNKKLLLITAIKTENEEIVLFPTKTITDIFSGLCNRLP